ncbi:MAG: hypothetical protein V4467_03015 [Patescibacteria group bacterium]
MEKLEKNPEGVELQRVVEDFDQTMGSGNLQTVEKFKEICKYRAQLVRQNIVSLGEWGKQDLLKEASRLEKAANGDVDELVAEAMGHARAHNSTREIPTILQKNRSKSQEDQEAVTAEKTWKRLARLVKKPVQS